MITETKKLTLTRAIRERVASGAAVDAAFDAVLGAGTFARLAADIYDELSQKSAQTPDTQPDCLNAAATRLIGSRIAELESQKAELLAALESLSEWGRTHTSPLDVNSPHELLIAAVAAIAKAKGGAK